MLKADYVLLALSPDNVNFDSPDILKALALAHRHLAELKGCAKSIPIGCDVKQQPSI